MKELKISEELKKIFIKGHVDYSDPNIETIKLPSITLKPSNIKEIAELFPHLKELDINTTKLKDEGCKYVGKLTELEWLDVSGNDEIGPEGIHEICKCTKLKWLDISLAQLDDDCIDDLLKLTEITDLLLSATCITVLNLHRLSELKHLKTLDLIRSDAGNSLPVKLVTEKDAKKILNFVNAKSNEKIPLGYYRLMLLGEPGSGKTAIFRGLTGAFTPETSTLGINIHAVDSDIAGKEMKDIKLNIWDFGGQDYQVPIHELFLSDHCLFTIVVEPRMNDIIKNFKKWYDLIKKYCHPYISSNSTYSFPIVVLFSKIDSNNGGLGYLVESKQERERIKKDIINIIKKDIKKRQLCDCNTPIENILDSDINIKFVESSTCTKDGLNEYKNTIINIINEIEKSNSNIFNVKEEVKLIYKYILESREKSNSEIKENDVITEGNLYLTKELLDAAYDDIITNLMAKNNNDRSCYYELDDVLYYLTNYGDVLYKQGTEYVFVSPDKLAKLIYFFIISKEYEDIFNEQRFAGKIQVIDSRIAKESLKILAKKKSSINNYPIDMIKCLLERLASANLIIPTGYGKYMIPNRAENTDKQIVFDTIKNNTDILGYNMSGSRHFVASFPESSKAPLYQLISKITKKLTEDDLLDNIDCYFNCFIIKSRINNKLELAIIYKEINEEKINIYITPGEFTSGLLKIIIDSLNSIKEKDFELFAICPCTGRLEDECSSKFEFDKLKEIYMTNDNFKITCLESKVILDAENLLKDSRFKSDAHVEANIEQNRLFVIMPYGTNDEAKTYYNNVYKTIKEACNEANEYLKEIGISVSAIRADDYEKGNNIDMRILNGIKDSKIILTLLKDQKPNCYFEYGMARSYPMKKFITYIEKDQKLPFDVEHIPSIQLNLDDPLFKKDLVARIKKIYNIELNEEEIKLLEFK